MVRRALNTLGLWQDIASRLVHAGNVGQAFQYAVMGTVQGSFIAASQLHTPQGGGGCAWEIPEAQAVGQKGCVLTAARNKDTARDFLAFLASPTAQTIMDRYGYQ